MANFTKLPALPAIGRKAKEIRPCICGCGMGTKSTWHTGHDGRATGWARRIEAGIMKLDEVPANERNGAIVMLKAREDARKAGKATA